MASKRFFLLAFAVLCAAHSREPASAASTSADDLLRLCRSSGLGADPAFCRGYIQAMVDAVSDNPELGCMPAPVSIDQIRDSVVNYLTTYPEVRNFPAYVVVADALSRIFSCKVEPPGHGPSITAP